MTSKALFLDRDGTINVEKNYLFRIEDFEFRKGIFELVKAFFNRGYLIFVVTNQSGIARGLYCENDFLTLTEWMIGKFREKGVEITKVYYCPHHPEITGECPCRKPRAGMFLEAIESYRLDPASCYAVGDKNRDLEAAKRAGIKHLIKVKKNGKIILDNVAFY
jgi:D-glycero-D-manno-heptose 1,7-bisphosphate phosphatase